MLPLLTSLKRNNWFGRKPKSIGLSLAYASTRTFRSASLGCQVQRSFSGVNEPCVSEAQTCTWSLWLSPSFILTSVPTRIANPRSAVRQTELSVACYRGLSWMILQKYIKQKTFLQAEILITPHSLKIRLIPQSTQKEPLSEQPNRNVTYYRI